MNMLFKDQGFANLVLMKDNYVEQKGLIRIPST